MHESLRAPGVRLLALLFIGSGFSALAGVSSILWAPLLPVSWDFKSLNMAAAVYLGDSTSARGEILFQREDAT